MTRIGKIVYFFFKASWNVLESLFFVIGTGLHAYLLRVVAHSPANFFSGMRWQWTWNDCRAIRKSFARQLFDFFLSGKLPLLGLGAGDPSKGKSSAADTPSESSRSQPEKSGENRN